MRKLLIVVAVLVLAIGGLALFLALTTTKGTAGIHFPLSARQRELLSSVPADADAFALVPGAAAFHARLAANPLTRDAIADWSSKDQMPRPWMVGAADLVVWRRGKQTSYAVRLDPVRAFLVRVWLMFGADVDARSSGGTFLINAQNAAPIDGAGLDAILSISRGMPDGDALVVQQGSSRGGFPPVGRPSVTLVQVHAEDIVLLSRAAAEPGGSSDSQQPGAAAANSRAAFRPRFPEGAVIAAQFAAPPRVAGDLDRLLGARMSHLLDSGGSIVLYDVNTRTLLPRPNGLFVVPAVDANREAVQKISRMLEDLGQVAESNGSFLIALDKQSLPAYQRENFVAGTSRATDWAVRADPKRLVPILNDLGDSTALRIATPRLYRSIRTLRDWTHYLTAAGAVEAEHAEANSVEELRVRISAESER